MTQAKQISSISVILTTSCSRKNFMMISQTVQSYRVDKQTNRHTQTDTTENITFSMLSSHGW